MSGRRLWNDNWYFAKTAPEVTFEQREIWESAMEQVDLPHDWLIFNTKNLYENSAGWYRKELWLKQKEGCFLLYFDGVYMDSAVYVNGRLAGEWKYGYSAFEWDITEYLQEGPNEVVVRALHLAPNSRWYSGAGIYRNVWLLEVPSVHIRTDGIYTSVRETEGGYELSADVEIQWADKGDRTGYGLEYRLFDRERLVFQENSRLSPGQERASGCFYVEHPILWDIENPRLYRLEVALWKDTSINKLHTMELAVGFRRAVFTPDQGFLLNGRKVRLNGACDHHDLGCLGAAFSRAAMKRKLLLMRSMGVNALRTSHNMPAREVMELADELGFLVVSEAFDMWEIPKNTYDYARFFDKWAERDVKSWICRDRSHPSVILWSIGNEISDTHAGPRGQELTRQLADWVREWDYRGNAPVTIGSNYMPWENARKCADIVKVAGYNYAEKYYEEHHREHPDWIIYGSETSSVVQSRGIYHFPLERATLIEEDEQCSALGNSTTSWGAKNAEYCIAMDRDMEFSCGQFIWTAFDYLGEPTPYQTKNSYFGQIDTAGFPKDSFYLYQAEWTDYKKAPMVHVYPYWDFNPGQLVDIRVCSNAPWVELFVNGRSMGRRKIDHASGRVLQPSWQVPYEPGAIQAVAYDEEGREIAVKERHSFQDTAGLVLRADKEVLEADGEDMIFVEISARDEDGYPVENAADYVSVSVTGAGRLVGLDNGDSTDYDQYKGTVRKLFQGKLLAVIAAKTTPGEITLEARVCGSSADDAEPALLTLQALKSSVRPGVSARTENSPQPLAFVEEGFVPVRKLELTVRGTGPVTLTPERPTAAVQAKLRPFHATDRSVLWKLTDRAGLECKTASLRTEGDRAWVTGLGDGNLVLRCMSKNGTDKVKLISCLDMEVKGMGTAYRSPYEPVSGISYSCSTGDVSRGPSDSAGTDKEKETCLVYKNLDFGDYGSDRLTLSVFANDSDAHSLQIWKGMPGEPGSELLGDVMYQKPSRWEVFQPETYTLTRRLCGIADIALVAHEKLFLKEFFFERQSKAFAKLYPSQTGLVYGDSYQRTEKTVEGIGNNVSIVYENMEFGEKGTAGITICGRTRLPHNTIQLRFGGEEDTVQAVEFACSEEYVCQSFVLRPVYGRKSVTFVFLPGSSFDFQWFQFQEA